jgi:hypothetical protein
MLAWLRKADPRRTQVKSQKSLTKREKELTKEKT